MAHEYFTNAKKEELIECVRKYPALYDKQLPSYRDKLLKDNIWKQITKDLGLFESRKYAIQETTCYIQNVLRTNKL